MNDFFEMLDRFRKFQLDNDEPYSFDLLGLMEWLEFDEKVYDFPITSGKSKTTTPEKGEYEQ